MLATTYKYDENMRPDDHFGQELRALIELLRWSGLRISDALMVARDRIIGNRFTLRTVKNGKKLTVILPDHVVAALRALPVRPMVDSSGPGSLRSSLLPASGRGSSAGSTNTCR